MGEPRVAVVGVGGVGACAVRALAQRGCRVVGYEQFELDHDRGSSYGGSRIIRRVYPDAVYASLMNDAYPLWRRLEAECGEELLVACGGLFFGPEGHAEMVAIESALASVGVGYERWSAMETRRRFPAFRLAEAEYAVYEPESGFLRASQCVQATAESARRAGAEIRTGSKVTAISSEKDGVGVTADGVTERFDQVVVAGGPWCGTLLSELHLPLTVTHQQYAHFLPSSNPELFRVDRFPVWIDFGTNFYGFPEHQDAPGAKVALHEPGSRFDPSSPDRPLDDGATELLRNYVRSRLPDLSDRVSLEKVCLYTNTPDTDFIIDQHPHDPRITLVGGLSGHGFKFLVLLGEIAARLVMGESLPWDLTRFRLGRFGTGASFQASA